MRVAGYPGAIPALTTLRYFAAAWVVLYHYSHFTGATALIGFAPFASGYLGVDFFFILSGFVLTHVYQPQIAAGRFDYWSFVAKRFARIYPMHVATLAAFVVLGLGTRYAGVQVSAFISGVSFAGVDDAIILRALIANLTLIHAWGATPWLLFNQPSWSISAEWFAYLLFPVLVLLRRMRPHREAAKLALVAAVFVGLALVYQIVLDDELTRLTWNAGILRIFPEFLIGMSLHRCGERWSVGPRGSMVGLWLSLLLCVAALLTIGAAPGAAIPLATVTVLGLAGIVFFAADADRHGRLRWTARPLPLLLGEISYSVYMVHLLVGIVLFDLLFPAWRPEAVMPALATVIGALVVATALSWLTYHAIEVPGRRWLVGKARTLNARGDS